MTVCFFRGGNVSVMRSFFDVCMNTRGKLDRELHDTEIEFLQWMYERYAKEQEESKQQI